MYLQGLNLNLLIALDALLREKSITRAAERVHISQPGMSAALKKLRLHYSDQLLQRAGRSLELTPRAKQLAGPVNELLSQIKTILDPKVAFDPLKAKRFNAEANMHQPANKNAPLREAVTAGGSSVLERRRVLATEFLSRTND